MMKDIEIPGIESVRLVNPADRAWISPLYQGYTRWTDPETGREWQGRVEWCPWYPGMWADALGAHQEALCILLKRDIAQGRHNEWEL